MSEVAAGGPTAGSLLRRAREAAGLHVASLAVSLKVPVRKLEALEGDRWDELPDTVFARALAASVCRALKVDPQPILERLPQGAAPRLLPEHEAINAPFRAPGDAPPPNWVDHLTRPVFMAVFALLLGALVLIFLPNLRREESSATLAKTEPSPPAAMVAPTLAEPPPAAVHEAPTAQAMPTAQPVATTATKVALAPAAAPAASAALPAASAAAVPASGLVVFRTRGPSWIEVTDSKGTVALRRLMAAGESAGASGTPPLAVTVGSASATSVEVRGKPFDLGPLARDNVARFEIK